MTEAVSYLVEGGVAWLTIERPEARNALNAAVREGLYAGVRRFNQDDTAKVLVLTGAGEKAFCAGGDLKEMAETALTVPVRPQHRGGQADHRRGERRRVGRRIPAGPEL
jgi:enoyl-CoA hydratase/carnithine racemase